MRIAHLAAMSGCLLALAAYVSPARCDVSMQDRTASIASPEQAAEAVFAKVAAGNPDAAYASVSPEFRALVGPNAWKAFVAGMSLATYQDVTWTAHQTTPHGVRVSGLLHARGALAMPVDVYLSQTGDAWMMDSIHFHRINTITLGEGAREPGMPPGELKLGEKQLAGACRQLLGQQPALEEVICMQATPGVAGAQSLCVGMTKTRVVGITVRVNSFDDATQNADISCWITDPDRPAGSPVTP